MLLLCLLASHQMPWGVLADGTAYIRQDKGIDAVALETGKPRWTVENGMRPVAEAGGVLVAFGPNKGGMKLVGLDAKTGKEKWSEKVELPDWVAVTGGLGRSFNVRSRVVGKKVVVGYIARAWYAGGAAPTEEILAASKKEATGALEVDPATGKTAKAGGVPAESAHRNGDIEFTIKAVKSGAVLSRTKGKKELEDVPLADPALRIVVARDGKTVAVQTEEGKRASWKAFDTATGKEAGKFETAPSLHAADLAGGRFFAFGPEGERKMAFGTFPRVVEAIDVKTGKALWQRKGESESVFPPPP